MRGGPLVLQSLMLHVPHADLYAYFFICAKIVLSKDRQIIDTLTPKLTFQDG
jgi:hypothetical protein